MLGKSRENVPELWSSHFPYPQQDGNKYDRGHAIICGGPLQSTGAAKISAHCALRSGTGLVSVACDAAALPVYATSFQAIMTKLVRDKQEFSHLISDKRVKGVLIGPGAGITRRTKTFVLMALKLKKPTVLDADALTVFSDRPQNLFDAIQLPCILTPHDGEFLRLFGKSISENENKLAQAIQAAGLSHSVVILKGFNTIIAAPDGRAAINNNSTPYLATAGSGDALAGICVGLLAQGMPAFEAACAAVWLHTEAALSFGPGLIAEDIADLLPAVLKSLSENRISK
jgi:NAD(P)H-hydrate epimerase